MALEPGGPARPPASCGKLMLAFGGGLLGILAARWTLDLSAGWSSSCPSFKVNWI